MYEYHDGNGNRYIIKSDLIEYIPVKPSQSSSGVYNGGDYVKKEISKLEYNQITFVLLKAVKNITCHIRTWVKMSGKIVVVEGANKTLYHLNPYSEEKEEIEKKLLEIVEVKK